MQQKSLGLIETQGLAAGIEAADAAVKSANVELVGYELTKGGGWTTVKVLGDVGAVKAAVDAAKMAAQKVNRVVSTRVIARPSEAIAGMLIHTADTVGDSPKPPEGPQPPKDPEPSGDPEPPSDPQPPETPEVSLQPEQEAAPEPAAAPEPPQQEAPAEPEPVEPPEPPQEVAAEPAETPEPPQEAVAEPAGTPEPAKALDVPAAPEAPKVPEPPKPPEEPPRKTERRGFRKGTPRSSKTQGSKRQDPGKS